MERLGQYLADAPLVVLPNMDGNDWTSFLSENECIQNHPSILQHYKNTSLIQQFKELAVKIYDIFDAPKTALQVKFKPIYIFDCFNFGEVNLRMSSINITKEMILFAFLQPSTQFFLLQVHITDDKCLARCGKFHFTQLTEESPQIYDILDVAFYSNNILSLLLQDTTGYKSATILQFPLAPALEKLVEIDIAVDISKTALPNSNGSVVTPKLFKNTEMAGSVFAVSGSRRVGIVLSENKRKIKLFEMEAEEEDEEDADMSSSIIKEDVSMQENAVEWELVIIFDFDI